MSRIECRVFAGVCLLALASAPAAHAATVFCIGDEAQFRSALTTVGSTFTQDDYELRLVARVFFNGTAAFSSQLSSNVRNLTVSGGWNAACLLRQLDPRATVIDAQGLSAVLSITRNSAVAGITPVMSVSNLTLRNGRAASAPVGLYLYNSFGPVEVDDVIVHGHRATASQYLGGTAITLDSTRHDIRLRNALVYDNDGQFISGGWPLVDVLFTSIGLNPDRQFIVTNTTIDGGPGSTDPALRLQSDGHFEIFNNIIRGEARFDVSITGAGAATQPRIRRVFNHMPAPVSNGQPVVDLESGNDSGDPQLDADYVPLPGSPVVNAGLGNPPGGQSAMDAYARPRVAFTFIDRGALESQLSPDTLFRNGFD